MEKEFNEKTHNRMCAEFLGYINETPEVEDFDMYVHPVYGDMIELNLFRPFTEDWNWIMKVCGKIYKILDPSDSRKHDIKAKVGALQKDAVVLAIWEFLNWYNENKNK
jgi:hypothetical protein